MSVFKNAMSWLGLGPEPEPTSAPHQQYDYNEASSVSPAAQQPTQRRQPIQEPAEFSAVRSLGPITKPEDHHDNLVSNSGVAMSNQSLRPVEVVREPTEAIGSVKAVPSPKGNKPQIIAPREFSDAPDIANHVKGGAPVLLNLKELDSDLTRRIIDFCSGMCYALNGDFERVGSKVFLITPHDVQLSAEDHRLLRASGLMK